MFSAFKSATVSPRFLIRAALISTGGGVYPRTLKSMIVTVPAEIEESR